MSSETEISKTEAKISVHDFYFETPLYDIIDLKDLEDDILNGEIDGYSSINHTETTYSISCKDNYRAKIDKGRLQYQVSGGIWYEHKAPIETHISLECKRKANDKLSFYLYFHDGKVEKIGQYPSLADIQFSSLDRKYNKVLPKEDLKDLKKAVGLASHHAGAGSFVYLRRIIERLIFTTYIENKGKLGIEDDVFRNMEMYEKIEFLKEYLPKQLLEMKSVYKVLSKGVHELSEEECGKYFSAIKLGIELILDQKIEMIKEVKKDAQTKAEIQRITQELGGNTAAASK